MSRPDLDFLFERPIAHRGFHDGGARPENSMAAFGAAADADYAIELDVRLSRDGRVIVFHDALLDRLTPERGNLAERDEAELTRIPLMGTTETIPLLVDVLEAVEGRVPLLVEIKNENPVAGLLEQAVCDWLSDYEGPAAVQSFNPATIRAVAEHAPELPRGFLFSPLSPALPWSVALSAIRYLQKSPRIDFGGCDVRGLPWDPVPALQGKLPLLGWTVTSADVERDAREWVQNVIFEGYRP
jgi:glycerophosphoryl diester phosphodiesterase